jgi:FeS assembly SUF system protein
MGLFSRFKKKEDDEIDGGAAGTAPDNSSDVGSSLESAGASAAAAAAADETPFSAPPEWDLAAFSAPVEPQPAGRPDVGPLDSAATAALQPQIVDALKTVYDPEIPVDIYELGLIYEIVVDAARKVLVRMTLTSPACPSAQQLPSEVRYKVKALPGVADAWVEVVWEPPWDKDRMSEAAKLQLGFF